jgi:hypothetical protein
MSLGVMSTNGLSDAQPPDSMPVLTVMSSTEVRRRNTSYRYNIGYQNLGSDDDEMVTASRGKTLGYLDRP